MLKMTWQAMTRTLLAKVSYKKRYWKKKEKMESMREKRDKGRAWGEKEIRGEKRKNDIENQR